MSLLRDAFYEKRRDFLSEVLGGVSIQMRIKFPIPNILVCMTNHITVIANNGIKINLKTSNKYTDTIEITEDNLLYYLDNIHLIANQKLIFMEKNISGINLVYNDWLMFRATMNSCMSRYKEGIL